MAKKRLVGNVAPVADVWTYTVVTVTAATVHGLAAGSGKTITITLGSGETTSTAASLFLAAIIASNAGEFKEYNWSINAAVITGIATTAGIPGTFTNASTGGTAGTLSNSTPATGPNFIDKAGNWTGSSLPINGDDVCLDASSPDALFGLGWFRDNSIVPATFNTDDFGGSIGLPPVRGASAFAIGPSSGASYPEYRDQFLELPTGTIALNIGRGSRNLPTRAQFDLAGSAVTVNVFGSKTPANGEIASIYLRGTTSHPQLAVSQGYVGVAVGFGETGGFDDVLIGDEGNPSSDTLVVFGSGATVPAVRNIGGRSEAAVTVADLEMGLNAVEHLQTAGSLTVEAYGGNTVFSADGTFTFHADGNGTVIDISKDPRPKTIGSGSYVLNGAKMLDPGDTRGTSEILFDETSLPISKLGPSVIVAKA